MGVLSDLKPQKVFYYFEELTKIPRGSGNTKQVSDFLCNFAAERNLEYFRDDSDNVIIKKKASAGYEQAPAVILQGHSDIVAVKEEKSDHDFLKDPLKICIQGDYITADGTTLGGDNGIAVAYMMALLDSEDIPHPALECVITSDEEIGLLGADALDTSVLQGKYMINLDSEEEGTILVSCAGGLTAVSCIPVHRLEAEGTVYELTISGLLGGHSGQEINKKRGNANLLMGRLLYAMKDISSYALAELEGGLKDNAIPQTCRALIAIDAEDEAAFMDCLKNEENNLRKEYTGSESGISITFEKKGMQTLSVLDPISTEKVIFYLMQVPNGIQKMSGTIENLPETSSNLGILRLEENRLCASGGIRSSVESAAKALSDKFCYLTEFLGGDYMIEAPYPAWEYRRDSKLRSLMIQVYKEKYGYEPKVEAIHAGLECGLFYKKIDGLDCVSIGPDMKDVHTTEEKLSISSAAKVWEYLCAVLENIHC